jgi:adenosylhomocysteine nucleosidase
MSMRIKLFVALPSEFPKEKAPMGVDVIYTGVGKVNAAIKATEVLKECNPTETIIINFGSAGSFIFGVGTLVRCDRFEQGDINTKPFAKKTITPFDELIYPKIEKGELKFGDDVLCVTRDQFQSNVKDSICDMEAYSIAKVCKIYGFNFVSYKFISDKGDANDWKENHNKGVEKFLQRLKEDFKVG